MAPKVPVHPVYAAYFEKSKQAPKARDGTITLEKMRELANGRLKGLNLALPDVIEQDKTVTHDGTEIRLTLFRPPGTENDVLPVVVYYHGGGWVFGSKHTHGKVIRDICVKNHVALVFVDYPLAPEVKFPTIHEVSYSALSWVVENGASIKVDLSKLAICGDSAGGNLSASLALMAKERGLGNAIKAQILIYPSAAPTREPYESYKLFGGGDYSLSLADIDFFGKAYYTGEKNKIGFPLMATQEDMKDLPPALVLVAEADVLRDEGEEYARRLTEAGVATAAVRVIGAIHGYVTVPVETPAYKQTMAMITAHLTEAFERT
ncbi:Alpha/Beta hydrolase protein [Zychaea mexicana]|uniref:Alpha/Beta hydrolase protein n=1 Tax=Zychaea mexicana TaxID=64656 RepID=UPI0022FDC0E0|nr:Alpha/Beta hydrolase protein [Zychaea mexicana]KAI9493375.1 Alpha/Beta hydrolase protein [Zychaea mexicana]